MSAISRIPPEIGYHGLRMSAEEYLALGETRERYELIHGTVSMSPSSFPEHGEVANEIGGQLRNFARATKSVRVFEEIDVHFSADTVYRPDICVYRIERMPKKSARLNKPPDLVIEILSPGTKPLDLITKRDDYEAFGVGEYWVVDPVDGRVKCWRRPAAGHGFAETLVSGEHLESASLTGFRLDLTLVREAARGE